MANQAPPVAAGRTYLVLDGRVVAQVVAFDTSCDPGLVEDFGLDDDEPAEVAPTAIRTFGVLGLIRRVGDGGAEGLGMTAPSEYISRRKYSSIRLVDLGTRSTIFAFDGSIVFGSENWKLAARGTMAGSIVFRATRKWLNEVTGATS